MKYEFGKANKEQYEAISTTEGPLLITAGPGTGKTFTLGQRAVYLIQECNVKPEEILIATFTEKAAKELITRITNELAFKNIAVNINEMYIGTFHSICLRIIKENMQYSRLKRNYILDGINKYLLSLAKEQIRLAFEQSEKEVRELQQRTKEGIETARLNGKQIGQVSGRKLVTKKSIKAREIIKKYNKSFGGPLDNEETRKLAGISRATFYKYKRNLLINKGILVMKEKTNENFNEIEKKNLQ